MAVNKAHKEFHAVDMTGGWEVPPGYPAGIEQKILASALDETNKRGTTILLVEQNANYALSVSTRGYVLETGTVALTDTSDNLRTNPEVQAAYLGGD